MKKEYELLKKLSVVAGVPGNEKKVSQLISSEIKDHVDELNYDHLGSVIGKKGQNGPVVMLAGHMDEVGLLVTQITKDGFVKFQTLGGWFSQVMLAQVWEIHTKKGIVLGVTGVKPPHIIPADKRNVAIEINTMYLDLGVSSKEEAEALGVEPGNMVVPRSSFEVLGNDKYLLGKAWDNRIGSAVVIEVLKRLNDNKQNQLYGTFTVQEEVGLRGAETSSNLFHPDIFLALDASPVNDAIDQDAMGGLGLGFLVRIFDPKNVMHQGLLNYFVKLAEKHKIPYQHFTSKGGTDAAKVLDMDAGILATTIGLPARYIHSTAAMMDIRDLDAARKMLFTVLKDLNPKVINTLKEANS